jgi:tetratricopeptide (TPR) repeat protein
MAATSRSLGNAENAQKFIKTAMEHVDRMTERERYRIRGLYYLYSGDFAKCVEEYSALVKLYPADNLGHNNLAGCYNELHNYSKALEELQSALQTTPNSAVNRLNISILATYTGDFQRAEQEARAVLKSNPSFEQAYIFLAYAQLGRGQVAEAVQTYQTLGKLSPLGTSMSASGLADLALYEGRFSDAVHILERGATADLAAKNSREAEKFAILAETQLLLDHKDKALDAAKRALLSTQKTNVRFLVARIFVDAGEIKQAHALAASLGAELSPEAQADAKLIEGEIALQSKDARKAIQLFTEANKLLETWLGWYDLGRAYLEAGLYVEADSEFDLCFKWSGQAMELLDVPTYGYFPPVYYYQGRVREGLKSSGAADSYRAYLSIRGKSSEDRLVPEIRRRLGQ